MTEDRISDLLIQWEDAYLQGRDISAEELCQTCRDLVDEVAQGIMAMKRTVWLIKLPQEGVAVESKAPPEEGQVLAGRYRLDALVATGAVSQVWRGFDMELQRAVAVKVPRSNCLANPQQIEGIVFEVRKAARLKHSGIVSVYDVGRHHGEYFIVSELISGANLDEYLRKGRVPVKEAVRIVADIAGHLNYAHEQKIIHHNIKPTNILVDSEGHVFITDFGMAVTDEEFQQGASAYRIPGYLSPEQVVGNPSRIDHRTDIYSLGVIFYELLTGEIPCQTDFSAGEQDVSKRKSWRVILRERWIPRTVQQICLKCLENNPRDRYATAKQLASDLHHWLSAPSLFSRSLWIGGTAGLLAVVMSLFMVAARFTNGNSPLSGAGDIDRRMDGVVDSHPRTIINQSSPTDLEISAFVHGRDQFIITPDCAIYEHLYGTPPGNVVLNGKHWSMRPILFNTGTTRYCPDQVDFSSAKVEKIQGRGSVKVMTINKDWLIVRFEDPDSMVGEYKVNCIVSPSIRFSVSARIDGTDDLRVSAKQLEWIHHDGFWPDDVMVNDIKWIVMQPSVLNNAEATRYFPDGIDLSSATLKKIQGRGDITITLAKTNILIVQFDDFSFPGGSWYKAIISFPKSGRNNDR